MFYSDLSNMPFVYRITVRSALILLIGFFLFGCKKEDTIAITGLLTDPDLSAPVANVTVELWTQKIEGGYFLANYVLEGTTSTGSDGNFSFNIEKKNFTGIRLIFSKEGYYGSTAEIDPEIVKNGRSSYASYPLLTKAFLHIRVINTDPFDTSDLFEFSIRNGYFACEECCKEEHYLFAGMDVDATIDCQTAGNRNILVQYSKRKNDLQIFKTESYYLKPFVTTVIELDY